MKPEETPAGALRISFEFWTTAPYTKSERETLFSDLSGYVEEGDDDVVPSGFDIKFENVEEIATAKRTK